MHPAPTPVSPSVRAVASKPAPVTRALKELILGHDVACQLAAFLPSVAAIFPSGSSNLTITPVKENFYSRRHFMLEPVTLFVSDERQGKTRGAE